MIRFQYQQTFKLVKANAVRSWLLSVLKKEKKKLGELQYYFVSDEDLLTINRRHLQHDYYTDVITFPYAYDPIQGEVYISVDRIKAQASEYGVSVQDECRRILVHALLHLCGYDDRTSKAKNRMTQMEDKYLKQYSNRLF